MCSYQSDLSQIDTSPGTGSELNRREAIIWTNDEVESFVFIVTTTKHEGDIRMYVDDFVLLFWFQSC